MAKCRDSEAFGHKVLSASICSGSPKLCKWPMSVWVGVSGTGLLPGSMQPAWGKENTFLDTKGGSGMTLMGVTGVVGQAELRTWLMEVTETEGQTPAVEFPPC